MGFGGKWGMLKGDVKSHGCYMTWSAEELANQCLPLNLAQWLNVANLSGVEAERSA
jgi:hypothetical protein